MEKSEEDYLYSYVMEHDEIFQMKVLYAVLSLLTFIATIIAGYIESDSGRMFFVTVPYACLIIPEAILCLGCLNVVMMVDVMVYTTYKKAVLWVNKTTRIILICGGVCLGSDFVFIIVNHLEVNILNEIMFFTGIMVTVLCDSILIVLQKKYKTKLVRIQKDIKEDDKDE